MNDQLKNVSKAACRFLYTNYDLDEIVNQNGMVMYCLEDKMVLAVHIRDDCLEFCLIFNSKEREEFEVRRSEFPQTIVDIYDYETRQNDGKWMWFPVADMETLEAVKKLIAIKLKPNRKPFPTQNAVYSKCGIRCDLCVHYTGETISDQFREELKHRVGSVFGYEDYGKNMMLCPGCFHKDSDGCNQLICARNKKLQHCLACEDYPCDQCGLLQVELQADRSTSAETIRWAILPYIGGIT